MTPEQRSRLSALLAKDSLTASETAEMKLFAQLAASDGPAQSTPPVAPPAPEPPAEGPEGAQGPEAAPGQPEDETAPVTPPAPAPSGAEASKPAGNPRLSIGAKLVALAKDKVALAASLATMTGRAEAAEKQVTALNATVAGLKKQLAAANQQVADLNAAKSTLSADVLAELEGLGLSAEDLPGGKVTGEAKPDLDCKTASRKELLAAGLASVLGRVPTLGGNN